MSTGILTSCFRRNLCSVSSCKAALSYALASLSRSPAGQQPAGASAGTAPAPAGRAACELYTAETTEYRLKQFNNHLWRWQHTAEGPGPGEAAGDDGALSETVPSGVTGQLHVQGKDEGSQNKIPCYSTMDSKGQDLLYAEVRMCVYTTCMTLHGAPSLVCVRSLGSCTATM